MQISLFSTQLGGLGYSTAFLFFGLLPAVAGMLLGMSAKGSGLAVVLCWIGAAVALTVPTVVLGVDLLRTVPQSYISSNVIYFLAFAVGSFALGWNFAEGEIRKAVEWCLVCWGLAFIVYFTRFSLHLYGW